MALQDFYEKAGGNYNEVKSLLSADDRITKFVKMFLAETTVDTLDKAIQENNIETAFRAAHTLKGNAANLAFPKLIKAAEAVCESLREGGTEFAPEKAPELYKEVKEQWDIILEAKELIEN